MACVFCISGSAGFIPGGTAWTVRDIWEGKNMGVKNEPIPIERGDISMKKRIFLLAALAAGLVLCLAACGETNGDPVTVTLWHVYGGEVNSPMNALVEEFNRTVGQEQGIRVRVDSVSNSGVIHESVLAAAYKDPGAPELPDLFVSYPKTVLALPDENILADYRDYFTDEELEGYLPEFVEEGTVHD